MLQLYEKKGRKIYTIAIIATILIFTLVLFTHEYISITEHIDEYKKIQVPQTEIAVIEEKKFNGQIEYIEGDVEVRDHAEAGWFSANKARVLESDNEVRTLNNSRAVITFEDGSSMRLDENTHIVIENPHAQIFVRVESGSIYNMVAHYEDRTYAVRASTYTVTARGTEFVVQKGYEGIGVMVVDSDVNVTNDRGLNIGDVEAGNKAIVLNDEMQKNAIDPSDLEQDFFIWSKKTHSEDEKNADLSE